MNAVSLHSMVNQTGQIIGPAVAGGVIELAGIGPTLLVNAGLYLSGIVFLLLIRGLPPRSAVGETTVIEDLRAGLQCIRSTPILYTVIGMSLAFAFFAVSYRQVMPAFTKEVLEIGAGRTGLLLLAAGLGSLLGNLILALAGGLPTQGPTPHGISAASFCGPDLVRLVALVLGILNNIIVRGSDEFRVFHPIGDHADSAQRAF